MVIFYRMILDVKEAVGFEPTVRADYRITGVQIRHLKPLGHASIEAEIEGLEPPCPFGRLHSK